MKKSKGQTVDLLYKSKDENSKKKNNNRTKNKSKKSSSNKIINLDNEIIIGLTPKKEKKTKEAKNKKSKKTNKKSQKKNNNKTNTYKKKVNKNKSKKVNPKKTVTFKIIKWICILLLFLVAIIIFMMSSVFNIKEIKVINNSKVSTEEIINLSTLELESNMFKITNRAIIDNIKANAYIENVNIKRSINGIITLDIVEREPTYMLKFANAYVYINNQGYMLEMKEEPLALPIITGFKTPSEQIKQGNRLVVEDLEKLEDVIKIMNSVRDLSLSNIITSIDILDSNNYKLIIESENKIVYFGNATNINIKLLRIEELIQSEKGIEGEIYFQSSDKTVFREKV